MPVLSTLGRRLGMAPGYCSKGERPQSGMRIQLYLVYLVPRLGFCYARGTETRVLGGVARHTQLSRQLLTFKIPTGDSCFKPNLASASL